MSFTKESVRRALRTFLQAFLGYIFMNAERLDFSEGKEALHTTLVGIGVSSFAAGLAAIMNMEEVDEYV